MLDNSVYIAIIGLLIFITILDIAAFFITKSLIKDLQKGMVKNGRNINNESKRN